MIADKPTKKRYDGNGSQKNWGVPFQFSRDETIKAVVTDPTGFETPVISNYSIEHPTTDTTNFIYPLNGDPLRIGWFITIYRETPAEQGTDLQVAGRFNADIVESSLDYIMLVVQEIVETVSRAVTLNISDVGSWEDLVDNLFLAAAEAKQAAQEAKDAVADLQVVSAGENGLMPAYGEIEDAIPIVTSSGLVWHKKFTITDKTPTGPFNIGDIYFVTIPNQPNP